MRHRSQSAAVSLLWVNLALLAWVAVSVGRIPGYLQTVPAKPETQVDAECNKPDCPAGTAVTVNAIHQEVILDRVAILGERNSGTNAVEQLFKKNLQPGSIDLSAGITQIKHYFQPWPKNGDVHTARTLPILVVRNPYDWLQSMHKMCYCCEDLSADKMNFQEFLTSIFELTLEDPSTHEKRPTVGCPVDVNIYDPLQRKFKDVLDARYQKALHFINVSRWSAGFELVHWEDILTPPDQEIVFKKIATRWKLKQSNNFVALEGDVRFWKPSDNFNASSRMSKSMFLNPALLESEEAKAMCRLINSRLDPIMEQILGYQLLKC